jgi:hypothetical protein
VDTLRHPGDWQIKHGCHELEVNMLYGGISAKSLQHLGVLEIQDGGDLPEVVTNNLSLLIYVMTTKFQWL